MNLELLDMLEEHIKSFRDEAKLKKLKEAYDNLIQDDDSLFYSFILGSLYGSCLFIGDSYSSKELSEKEETEFNQWFYNHVKGLKIEKSL